MPINLRNSEHPQLHYQDLARNGFQNWHEPIGGIALWNGQMENGPDTAPEGWELASNAGGTITRVTGGVAGNWCLKGGQAGVASGGTATSLKYIPVDLTRTYILEFAAKADAVSTSHYLILQALCYDANKAALATVNIIDQWRNIPATWTKIVRGIGASAPWKFTANTAYVRFRFYLSPGAAAAKYVYLDDVRLRLMPEEQEFAISGELHAALYGAWGDGNSHVLTDWFANLANAQAVYPTVVALTDELDWAAINTAVQDASTVGGGVVRLSAGVFLEKRPIVFPTGGAVRLIGAGYRRTFIQKTATTVGPGPDRDYHAGNVTDNMDVDAIIILDHADNVAHYYSEISDLSLDRSVAAQGGYGLYAPRVTNFNATRMYISGNLVGVQIFLAWVTHWKQITITGLGAAQGSGFIVSNDGSGVGGGTSYHIASCYVKEVADGWYFYGCSYSSLRSCAADSIGSAVVVGTAYSAYLCSGFDIIACGCEVVTGRALWLGGSDRRQRVTGFRGTTITGFSATYGTVHVVGGRVTFSNCVFDALLAANGQYNERYETNGGITPVVTWENSQRPSGGVQNYHVANDDIITTHDLRGWKTPITSGTAFQLLHFWTRNVLGAGNSTYMGSCSGWLNVAASVRTTTGNRDQVSRMYFITVWAWSNTALTVSVQQVGVDQTEGIAFTAIAVAARAGATMNDLFLDATFTLANPDNAVNFSYWSFTPQSGATQDSVQLGVSL